MAENAATCKVVVQNPSGLHARPSLAIAKTVQRYQSKVEIRSPGQTVDASQILQLLGLGATQGTELEFTATGPDAREVLDELARLFDEQFGLCGEPA